MLKAWSQQLVALLKSDPLTHQWVNPLTGLIAEYSRLWMEEVGYWGVTLEDTPVPGPFLSGSLLPGSHEVSSFLPPCLSTMMLLPCHGSKSHGAS
jgi:hypothetical protein